MNAHFNARTQRAAVAIALALCAGTALAQAKVLRFVPQADLKVLDPIYTTNYVTRNYAHLVYDTLFGLDATGAPQPQMVDKHTASKDGLRWSFTLRPGLKFHDGSAVTAADCVASLQRWAEKDSHGRAMAAAGAEWKAVDAQTFTLTLKQPFGAVLEALAKASSVPPVIMPERVVRAAGKAPVSEAVGSGPYVFKRDEWVPGNKVVFVRNPQYAGRGEASSFLAGSKRGHAERIEWLILPDTHSAVAALQRGEVDMLELVPPDNVGALLTDPSVKVRSGGAFQAAMVMNNVQPPFNNPKVRQAVLRAVDQERFLAAMGYSVASRLKHCASFFVCGKPNETAAGSQAYAKPDLAAARRLVHEAGYKGEKVVVLVPTDYPTLNAGALVAIQLMKDLGLNVEPQTMDWTAIVSRRVKKDPVEVGGWSAYVTFAAESSVDSPLNNFMLGAACGNSMPGWPCDRQLDELRAAWLAEAQPAKRKVVLDAFQTRAYETVPYVPLGQYSGSFAVRKGVKNVERLTTDIPVLWSLDK